MNFDMEENDPDFSLTPGARSRLASLFQGQEPSDENPNQALIYTAPKQPKKQEQTSAASEQLKLLHAVPVHTYILEGGKYSSQGQAGAAILGSHETSTYKLLLYKGKQQKITCCSINANFSYRVQEKNYANFYDDRKVNWSIMFESEQSSIEFAKQIALAKASSCGSSLNSTIIQDLTAGEGTVILENGGSADVYYTGWIFSNHALGDVFDSNIDSEKPLRLRMGKSKVIKGWSGLLGSKKGTKRLVIIPPAFAYGSEGVPDKVPSNAVVVYEFFIKKVKEAKDSPSLSQSPAKSESDLLDKKPEISPKPHSQSITDESIRMRGASISEQLMQSPKKGNATIISRMAKMGTATLPLPGAVVAQPSSESEAEDECFSKSDPPTPPVPAARSRESSPKPVPKPRSSSSSGSTVVTQSVHPMPAQGFTQTQISHATSSQQVPVYATASIPSQQHHLVSDSFPLHVYPQATSHAAFPIVQPAYAAHHLPAISPTVVPGMTDTHLTLLLTETRSQNTEVRLSLSKISDKVETILQKVEDIKSQEGSHSSLHYMESNVLVQNIQRIVQENTRLKEEVEAKSAKIQSLNEKICDLLQKNQKFFEESNNYLEQKTESSLTQSRILNLEQEKAKLMSEINDALAKASGLQSELENSKKAENELSEKLKVLSDQCKKQQELVESVKMQSSDKENLVPSLQKSLQEAEQEKNILLQKIRHMEQKLSDFEHIKTTLEMTIKAKETEFTELLRKLENQKEKATASSEAQRQSEEELQNKLRELQSRYESLYARSSKQKERFDSQIVEMKSRMRQHLISQSSANPSTSETQFDIRKTMNILYRLLQAKVNTSESYGGEEVLEICLETIRRLTVQVLSQKQKLQAAPQSDDSGGSTSHSVSGDNQMVETTSLGVSPPKSSDTLDSKSMEGQKSESSSLSASPSRYSASLDSYVGKTNVENSIQSASEGDVSSEGEISRENPLLHGTIDKEATAQSHSEHTSHESSEMGHSHKCKNEQLTESSLVQEVQNAEADEKLESQISSDKVIEKENGDSQKTLDVHQENVEDRKTPDVWKPQPPPLPLFDDDEDDDDWLK